MIHNLKRLIVISLQKLLHTIVVLHNLNYSKNEMIRLLIKTIFKIIGAAAAAANLLLVFKIPEKKDDKLTKSKNGNVILVNSTAISNFNPLSTKSWRNYID